MSITLRSALLIAAAMSASSVAPAQTSQATEPLQFNNSTELASVVIPTRLPAIGEELSGKESNEPDAAQQDREESPVVDRSASLPELISQFAGADPGSEQLECLAAGIYFESKGEPLAGQLAVGEVISNRASSGRFPSSYCGVLFQRGQFSFVRGHSWPHVDRSSRAWRTAVAMAKIVDGDMKDSPAANALYFHAKRVHPGWRRTRVASIGNHIFFR
jgi:spore germination cell wall hydrolase CwlJ-like protein